MKQPPTLIDRLYRMSFRREPIAGWTSNQAMRELLTKARRFVLDDSMSAFLADLAHAGFKMSGHRNYNARMADQLRVSARSPHKVVWIEYNLRAETVRANELNVNFLHGPSKPSEVPSREGWLIEQHPGIETAFRMHLFSEIPKEEVGVDGFEAFTFPFCYAWTADDTPLPWNAIVNSGLHQENGASSEVYLGVPGYRSDRVAVVQSDLIWNASEHPKRKLTALLNLLAEWTGLMRRTWALLATINDIPMSFKDVRQSKGFVARGAYRKFLDHRTITLNIPGKKDRTKVARNLIAQARRRAHSVRGHWRKDWHHPGASQCSHHWGLTGHKCDLCGAQRMWIHEHQRGDAGLGFVTHSYQVTHQPEEEPTP